MAFLLDFNASNKEEHNTKKEIQLPLKMRKVKSACLRFLRLHNYHF